MASWAHSSSLSEHEVHLNTYTYRFSRQLQPPATQIFYTAVSIRPPRLHALLHFTQLHCSAALAPPAFFTSFSNVLRSRLQYRGRDSCHVQGPRPWRATQPSRRQLRTQPFTCSNVMLATEPRAAQLTATQSQSLGHAAGRLLPLIKLH